MLYSQAKVKIPQNVNESKDGMESQIAPAIMLAAKMGKIGKMCELEKCNNRVEN